MKQFVIWAFRSPLLWGTVLCAAFYSFIVGGVLNSPMVSRYFNGHPVENVETFLFFIGLSALFIKGWDVYFQRRAVGQGVFGSVAQPESPQQATVLLARLATFPKAQQSSYLIQRFRKALEHVKRNESAQNLEDELKYLADMDAATMQQSYSLMRIVVWAIPILGFLGTVIGITVAMGELGVSVSDGGDSLKNMLAGLSVAFDTTALALALSMVLMFTQYVVEGRENELLNTVNIVIGRELAGRFETLPEGPEGDLTAIRRMLETVLSGVDESVRQQAAIWRQTFADTEDQWRRQLVQTGAVLEKSMTGALSNAIGKDVGTSIAQSIGQTMNQQNQSLLAGQSQLNQSFLQTQQQINQEAVNRTDRMEKAIGDSAEGLASLEQKLVYQMDVLGKSMAAVNQISSLEQSLNKNLNALAGSRNFEKTVMSLAAAIQLLSSRLSDIPQPSDRVELTLKKDEPAA